MRGQKGGRRALGWGEGRHGSASLRTKDGVADQLGDLRRYGVAKRDKSVHPIGKPIRNSNCSGEIGCAPKAATYLRQAGHFCIDGAVKLAFVVGVCTNPPTASAMVSPRLSARNTARLDSGIAEVGKKVRNTIQGGAFDVLGDDDTRLKFSDEPGHLWPHVDSDTPPTRRTREWLAREPAADGVNGNSIGSKSICGEVADVMVAGHLRPVLGEDAAWELFDLAERDGLEPAGALQTERKAADAAEQVEKAVRLFHAAPHKRRSRREAKRRIDSAVADTDA
jgi:hypothetical protein